VAVTVPNQWAATFTQPTSFGTTPPALQSVVVALTPANSVGGGTGTPTAGNWLFCLAGMNEQASKPGFTVGVGDDIHSFWRPGNETTSTWAVSTSSALTRTAIWYTANTVSAPGNVYVAPNGSFDALTVLVVEVAGLGPWDTVTGINTNYAAAATTLNLALGAPSGSAFLIAAVAGDSTTAGQAFAPASWTTLHTTSVTNGVDHTCDSVLTSAWITTSGSISVNGTATSAADLSGAVIGVLASASSPIPAGQNPNWPLAKFEAAFGGGFQTPQDQLTWTDLSSRLWSWNETTGIQYQLGQIQATELNLELDNFDNLLASDNPLSYFYTASGVNWHPSSAFYDTLVAASSPLAWWQLDDASGSSTAADSSGNSHTGTATSVTFGSTNEAVTGNTSASFASGSTSHILTTYNPGPLSALSVEAWVNLNGLSQGANNPRLAASSHTDADSKGFQLMVTNGRQPQFWVGSGTATANASGGTVPVSGWAHLAGTWDGTTIRLYVNGVLAVTGAAAFSGSVAAGLASGIGLGYNPAYSGDYLNGLLAEVAVYGTALSAAQVAAHYTAGPAGTGTPLRLRMALGTIGGVTVNRWYVIQRNAEQWPQHIDPTYRRMINATATDIWSVLASSGPSPYRGEVEQDSPYAWWPMDDQPLAGGVLPTSLRNFASGNTNVLNVIASPGGVSSQDPYSTTGTDISDNVARTLPSVAVYTAGQNQGWMYGDPQSSPQSYATSNPVTASPGSASWQMTGGQGTGGSAGWFLSCNDANFPPLSGGVTVKGWFNAEFFGSSTGYRSNTTTYTQAGQPYGPLSLCTLTTNSAPVAILQLDTSGHLNLITYNGTTPTSHAIYTSSDLHSGGWVSVDVLLTTSTWRVLVNGGVTADVSGSGTSMTSAWTWLVLNGDMGNTSGGGTTANIQNGGNVSLSHWAVFPALLPAFRPLAHYCAASTAFGLVPAPTGVSLALTLSPNPSNNTTFSKVPDGSLLNGGYGGPFPPSGVGAISVFTFSVLATANIGSYSSGPSARTTIAGLGQTISAIRYGYAAWVSWIGVAPAFTVYTAASANAETSAATVAGSGDSFSGGFGAGATGAGVCQTAGGAGSSPPAAASALGDTVAQRLERILGYASASYPGRCVDPASLAVQAATDIGGQQTGQNIVNIAASDGGLLFVDNLGSLSYWQKSHLASQYSSPAWTLTPQAPPAPGAPSAAIPYYREGFDWTEDPQRVWNAILITPFSPDGSSLADITPVQSAQVNASQQQYGAQPRPITSYLQSTAEMQNQANFLFEYFGTSQIRVEGVKVDAAPYPAAFPLILGINVGDLVSVTNWQLGGGGAVGTFRVSNIRRRITFGGDDPEDEPVAEVVLQLDFEPPSYWT
jgi:hypothetical protein